MSLPPHNFNPNDKKFRSCCCHVKTFTIIFGVVEIFAICFLLVAVLPDVNTKLCSEMVAPNTTTTPSPDFNVTSEPQDIFVQVKQLVCDVNIVWLVWAVLQIFALNVMFYGMKSTRWKLFIPHILFRCICTVLMIGVIVMLLIEGVVGIQTDDGVNLAIYSVGSLAAFIIWSYVFICEFRCCQFVKRSFETGFSISNTRPIGPSTISLSENRPHTAATNAGVPRTLPPLKHTYTIGRPPMYLANQEKNDNGV